MADDELQHYRDALVIGTCPLIIDVDDEGIALIKKIEAAFSDASPCIGLTWVQGEMVDNHENSELLEQGGAIDRYQRWQDVPAMLLANFPSAGWFLDDRDLVFTRRH